jgi:polar amino acid transport system substrate-binding protein
MQTLRVGAAFPDPPYLISGQSLAVDTTRLPHVQSIDDLDGLVIGVQRGNTSQPIADRLVAQGRPARVRVYDYGSIRTALSDLTTGGCDVFMKLASSPSWCDRSRASTWCGAELEETGSLPEIRQRWLGNPDADQSSAVH